MYDSNVCHLEQSNQSSYGYTQSQSQSQSHSYSSYYNQTTNPSSAYTGNAYNNNDNSNSQSPLFTTSTQMDASASLNTANYGSQGVNGGTEDTDDSPVLRGLLNKRAPKRPAYAQCYDISNAKKQKACNSLGCTPIAMDNGTISPVRTEDGIDYLENCDFERHQPITMPAMIGDNSNAASINRPLPQSNSSTPFSNSSLNSPMASYIEGISTPPLSPKDSIAGEHVNQTSNICDASSGVDQQSWTQNGTDKANKEKRSRQTYTRHQTQELEKEFH